jgi:hypothetical protein
MATIITTVVRTTELTIVSRPVIDDNFFKGANGVSPLTWRRRQSSYLEFRTMDSVHKPNDSERYTPSSETCRIYKFVTVFSDKLGVNPNSVQAFCEVVFPTGVSGHVWDIHKLDIRCSQPAYEEFCLLGNNAMQFSESQLTSLSEEHNRLLDACVILLFILGLGSDP